jgi:hypothetical protein
MKRTWRRFVPVVFSLIALGVLTGASGCKAKPGDKCTTNGRFTCQTQANALLCQGGIVISLPCRGPKGCQGAGASSECDDDLAQEGDNCAMTLNENYSCSTDHKQELVCTDGKFAVRRTCKGQNSCAIQGSLIHCDDSVADVGDACVEEAGEANYACSVDKTSEIVCKGKKFEESNSCRGPKGCWIMGEMVHCDSSFAREGEICRPVDNNACAEDAKSELRCSPQGKWAKRRECRREGCKVKGNELYCD